MGTEKQQLAQGPLFRELDDWAQEAELRRVASAYFEARRAMAKSFYEDSYRPARNATDAVSESALRGVLRQNRDVHGISQHPEISNVISFQETGVSGVDGDPELMEMRRPIDDLIAAKMRDTFELGMREAITNSGDFWYPPGSYMGWHTNSRVPGWRIYLSYAEEPGKSFFRYRLPGSSDVVTDLDDQWNVRMFRVSADQPIWHAVYSDTHRLSLGYVVYRKRWLRAVLGGVRGRMTARTSG